MLQIIQGDALQVLQKLPENSINCCVTSPPYWGLRDYGIDGQIGLEASIEEYVDKIVEVFGEVRRVLRGDGTCWVNLGDTYCSAGGTGHQGKHGDRCNRTHTQRALLSKMPEKTGLKPKDICGVPWRVAFALQRDGWYLRQDIIWSKPNPMPESVTDRCTKAHEYLFLLSKSEQYRWDQEAMMEPVSGTAHARIRVPSGWGVGDEPRRAVELQKPGIHRKVAKPGSGIKNNNSFDAACVDLVTHRNKRSVWTIQSDPYPEAHFATYPPDLIKPCILAGCPEDGTVLDPFAGSGTTGAVAIALGRRAILIELNSDYVKLIHKRCDTTPGFKFGSHPTPI